MNPRLIIQGFKLLSRTTCRTIFLMLLLGVSILLTGVQPARSQSIIYVPDDYPTIQEAINAAHNGDSVKVRFWYWMDPPESIVVNKSVSLSPQSYCLLSSITVEADDVFIKWFDVEHGIDVFGNNVSIVDVSAVGIEIFGDNVSVDGILCGSDWQPYGPAVYLEGANGCNISEAYVDRIDESCGILVVESSNNVIANCEVDCLKVNGVAILELESSFNNTVCGNTFWARFGPNVIVDNSSGNMFFNNTFNMFYWEEQVTVRGDSANVWDVGYPDGGNYWSDYNGTDSYGGVYQNETGSDGIGDTPYVIDENNQDRYPLVTHNVNVADVALSKTVVGEGHFLNVSVTIENQGDYTETFNTTAYANTTIIDAPIITVLASGNATTLTLSWNTTGVAKGNYMITACAQQVPGERSLADNNFTGGWVTVAMVGDITGPDGRPDGKCDMRDVGLVARHFGQTVPPAPANCDMTGQTTGMSDGKVDMRDLGLTARHFGVTA